MALAFTGTGQGGSGLRSGYGQGLHAHAFLPDGGDTPVPGPRVAPALWSSGDGHVVSSRVPGLLGSPQEGAASCRGMRPSHRQLQRRPCQQCRNTQPTPVPTRLRLKTSSSSPSGALDSLESSSLVPALSA